MQKHSDDTPRLSAAFVREVLKQETPANVVLLREALGADLPGVFEKIQAGLRKKELSPDDQEGWVSLYEEGLRYDPKETITHIGSALRTTFPPPEQWKAREENEKRLQGRLKLIAVLHKALAADPDAAVFEAAAVLHSKEYDFSRQEDADRLLDVIDSGFDRLAETTIPWLRQMLAITKNTRVAEFNMMNFDTARRFDGLIKRRIQKDGVLPVPSEPVP